MHIPHDATLILDNLLSLINSLENALPRDLGSWFVGDCPARLIDDYCSKLDREGQLLPHAWCGFDPLAYGCRVKLSQDFWAGVLPKDEFTFVELKKTDPTRHVRIVPRVVAEFADYAYKGTHEWTTEVLRQFKSGLSTLRREIEIRIANDNSSRDKTEVERLTQAELSAPVTTTQVPEAIHESEESVRDENNLSEMERNIMAALSDGKRLTGEKLADAAGYDFSGTFKNTLANLRRRGLLDNRNDTHGRGYERSEP
ncbi:MAG: hypothetical protein HJJLKODD_02852 [Phycisphaerae bacterium]|nr:hypothetical protein [Phycisphaerae bacterium]